MSKGQDIEAGLMVENIPLISSAVTGFVDESKGVVRSEHDKAGDIHDEQHCIVGNMAEENLENNLEPADISKTDEFLKLGAPKYQIDLINEEENQDGNCDGYEIQFMKMRVNVNKEMVRKDVKKLREIIRYKKFGYHDSIILVDDFDAIDQGGFNFFKNFKNPTKEADHIFLIANGFPYWVDCSGAPCVVDVLAILPTQSVIGNAVSASDFDKSYLGKLQIHNDLHHIPSQFTKGYVLLLESASKQDLLQYKLACHDIRIDPMNCLKIIMYGNEDILKAIADGYYFDGNIFTVVVRNNTALSSALWSFVNEFKENSKELEKAEEELIMACQDIAKNERIDISMIIQNIKHNIHSIFTCRSIRGKDLGLKNSIHFAISTAFLNEVSLIVGEGNRALKRFETPDYASKGAILVFKNPPGFSNILAKYLEDEMYKEDQSVQLHFIRMRFHETRDLHLESIIRNINRSKLKVYDSSKADSYPESAPNRIFELLKKALAQIVKTWLFSSLCLDPSEYNDDIWCPIMNAIYCSEPLMLKELLVQEDVNIKLNTYIVCNLQYHWFDKFERAERNIGEFSGIPPQRYFLGEYFASQICRGEESQLGISINNDIAKLSNGIIANCFLEDGSLNLENVSPIQALIINRILCVQFDMVKVLFEHDRENVFVNAMLIWILIDGILREGIFSRENCTEELNKAKEYFSAAIIMLLDQMVIYSYHFFRMFTMEVPLFRKEQLYKVAVDAELSPFLSHITAKDFASTQWLTPKKYYWHSIDNFGKNYRCTWKENIMRTPRMKLYVHMAMHVISYVMLACYTLQISKKINAILRWALFIMILSLFMDEVRQALGENPFAIRSSLKRWWRDGWNKIDVLSMMFYFIAFSLDCGGIKSATNLLYPAFSFIWCLKFYQFLRAFKSLGTYIILVQKMLPQLGNFVVVAMIAIISYGVFMTSILFPKIKFESWSIIIMLLSRPYLLLFAETGINEYDLSAKNTMYNTPKIPTASEVFVIVGMCIFLMFGSVLLLNLLIAIFSGIYEDVYQKSEIIWALNSSQLLQEFQCKPDAPVPFSLPLNVYLIIKRLTKHNEHMTLNDYSTADDFLLLTYYQSKLKLKNVQKEEPTLESMINRIDNLEQYCKEALKSGNANLIDVKREIKGELQHMEELLQRLQDIKKD